jgi:hypothetical protein
MAHCSPFFVPCAKKDLETAGPNALVFLSTSVKFRVSLFVLQTRKGRRTLTQTFKSLKKALISLVSKNC